VEKIVAEKSIVKPGETVGISVFLREHQGQVSKIYHSLKIPRNLKARRISIFAGSGSTLTRLESRTAPHKFRPKNYTQLLNLLQERRRNNSVFFQVLEPDQGVAVEGEPLPGLPPSVLSVIRAGKSSGDIAALRNRVLFEEKYETAFAVSGGKSIVLRVEHKK